MRAMDMNREEFADRIGCPWTTFKKWIAPETSVSNYREMPTIAWSLIREVLAHEQLKKDYDKLRKTREKCFILTPIGC